MVAAFVLTPETAEELGFSTAEPVTFAGVFPGVWTVGEPVEAAELGFETDEAAVDALDDAGVPLEVVHVEKGSAPAVRHNHAASELEAVRARVDDAVDAKAGGRISTHAEADAVAAELGIEFPAEPRPRLDEKLHAIETVRAGGSPAQALDDGEQEG